IGHLLEVARFGRAYPESWANALTTCSCVASTPDGAVQRTQSAHRLRETSITSLKKSQGRDDGACATDAFSQPARSPREDGERAPNPVMNVGERPSAVRRDHPWNHRRMT